MKGNLVNLKKEAHVNWAWLNILCTGLYCAVVKPFTVPRHCERNVFLSD